MARFRVPSRPQRALVVEDDAPARELLRRQLEAEGWEVTEAANGRVALDQLAGGLPGVILLDLIMPEMDGFEFLDRLRERPDARLVPVIVVTAKELTRDERDRLNGHVSRILQKGGYGLDSLMAQIRQVVGPAPSPEPDAVNPT
jgi:CheY-like chemotaxis protein